MNSTLEETSRWEETLFYFSRSSLPPWNQLSPQLLRQAQTSRHVYYLRYSNSRGILHSDVSRKKRAEGWKIWNWKEIAISIFEIVNLIWLDLSLAFSRKERNALFWNGVKTIFQKNLKIEEKNKTRFCKCKGRCQETVKGERNENINHFSLGTLQILNSKLC